MGDKKIDLSSYGLLYEPDVGNRNDEDQFPELMKSYSVKETFSERDQAVLRDVIQLLGEDCKAILEIGVNNHNPSSTSVILSTKPNNCSYFGVDLLEKNLKSIIDENNKVYCLKANSSEYDRIVNWIISKGCNRLDLIHIDGFHSVNQILKDWKYTKLLSEHGHVVLHDTNAHPGPVELIKALDRKVWKVHKHFSDRKDDWGISVIRKNK